MFRKTLTYTILGVVAATSIPVQAGTSIWKRDDPGSYMDGDTTVGGWNLNGASSDDVKYKGPWNNCPGAPNTAPCQATHSQAIQYGWSWATAFAVTVTAGIKDFGSVAATVTNTYTKLYNETQTNSFGFSVPPGQTWQFVSYVPRRYGSASLKGVMVDTGRTWNKRTTQCGPRTCKTIYRLHHWYEWQPGTYGGVISGNKNTRTEPIWTWRQG
jgi:hypothetical protein